MQTTTLETLGTWTDGEGTNWCAVAYGEKVQVTERGRLVAVETESQWLQRYDNLRDAGWRKLAD